MHVSRRPLATVLVVTGLHPIAGQTTTHVLRGLVSSLQGAPVAGASVFLLESIDGAPSGADGRFTLRTTAQGRVAVVGRHVGADNELGSTLAALEVVSTPGATADAARAMQTLPGVRSVDEGTGLFVRGEGRRQRDQGAVEKHRNALTMQLRNSDGELYRHRQPVLLDGCGSRSPMR